VAATPLQPAKRSFVSELFAFARQYLVRDVVVEINRDSPEKDVLGAFKTIARKVHMRCLYETLQIMYPNDLAGRGPPNTQRSACAFLSVVCFELCVPFSSALVGAGSPASS